MGVNIYLIKYNKKNHHKFEDIEFDSIRYVGDRQFAQNSEFEWDVKACSEPYCCDYLFSRPKNIDEAVQWVKDNVPQTNQIRLLDALNKMKNENDLYFNFSY